MPVNFGLDLLIPFCTVHVLSCVLVEIFGHTTVIHVPVLLLRALCGNITAQYNLPYMYLYQLN